MAAIKGYPSKNRDLRLGNDDVYITAEPIRQKQHGMSVEAHSWVRVVGTDATESGTTTTILKATSHAAIVGDVIRFTGGALSGQEVKVLSVATNFITLAETLSVAPGTDAFQILRHKYPIINADGTQQVAPVTTGPLQYTKDGVTTLVSEDTAVEANSRPLPVKLMGVTGPVNITAGDLNVDLDHTLSSIKIGDGTDIMLVNTDGSLNALVTAVNLDIRDLSSASDSVTVVASDLDVRDLVFASDKVDVSGSSVSVSASALPTGAATEVTSLDIATNMSSTAANTGNILTAVGSIDSKITACNTGAVVISSGSVTVSATDLDVRDLLFASDAVDVSGSSVTAVVSATDLDIRNLAFATDLVDVSGSSVTAVVSATDLDIRDLAFVSDKVDASGSVLGAGTAVIGHVIVDSGAISPARDSVKQFMNMPQKAKRTAEAFRIQNSSSRVFSKFVKESKILDDPSKCRCLCRTYCFNRSNR